MESNAIKIGRAIKTARERLNMTQNDLSTTIGCSSKHISAIERGIKSPRLETIIKIINILHITPNILFQDIIEFDTDFNNDKEFSSIVGWLTEEDRDMVLRVVTTISRELYDRRVRNIMEE